MKENVRYHLKVEGAGEFKLSATTDVDEEASAMLTLPAEEEPTEDVEAAMTFVLAGGKDETEEAAAGLTMTLAAEVRFTITLLPIFQNFKLI